MKKNNTNTNANVEVNANAPKVNLIKASKGDKASEVKTDVPTTDNGKASEVNTAADNKAIVTMAQVMEESLANSEMARDMKAFVSAASGEETAPVVMIELDEKTAAKAANWMRGAAKVDGVYQLVEDDSYKGLDDNQNWNPTMHVILTTGKTRRIGASFAEVLIKSGVAVVAKKMSAVREEKAAKKSAAKAAKAAKAAEKSKAIEDAIEISLSKAKAKKAVKLNALVW